MFTIQAGEAGGLNILWRLNRISSYKLGAHLSLPSFSDHQWWRLITAMFLHGGLIHIGFNMMTLMQFGPTLEEVYGSPRFLFLYTFTGAVGFAALVRWPAIFPSAPAARFWDSLVPSWLSPPNAEAPICAELRSRLISSLVILFLFGIFGGFGIDNWAHGGGLASGFVLGKLFADREPINKSEKSRAQILGWLSGLAIIASFVLMLFAFS